KREGNASILIDHKSGVVTRTTRNNNGVTRVELLNASMPAFVEWLTPHMDHAVIDATGLTGSYKLTLEVPAEALRTITNRRLPADLAALIGATPFSGGAPPEPSEGGLAGNAPDPSGGAISKAVEKLGLKLEKRNAALRTLIIESIERNPTPN